MLDVITVDNIIGMDYFRDSLPRAAESTWGLRIRGPDVLQVRDRRAPDASARFALDHPDLVATFRACLTPTALDDLSSTGREAVPVLASEGLVLVTRGWAVTLPPRIRHWTVPDTGV
ncbi:DUF5825 family protein [Kitasatospora sp. NPDC056808]